VERLKDTIQITAGCKLCKLCIKNCPEDALYLGSELKKEVSKDEWKGVMVYVEHEEGEIHPVTFELIGKARELANKIKHPVYCILIGSQVQNLARELLYYGVDKVFVYDDVELKWFRSDSYTLVFEDCINKTKPSIVLVGATSVGRSLAPRVAARFKTGLTADCTVLDVKENTDLVQIRPAFGGNIMAQIVTTNSRPQMATVRYKVMEPAQRVEQIKGEVINYFYPKANFDSKIRVLDVSRKERKANISEADVIVVAGRGIKEKKDMQMVKELADLLNGQVAATRSLIEAGWASHNQQIGLSGRTVRPKLIITCGVSGAVQFVAGMQGSEYIFAINKDVNAPIFKIAHYCAVGDLYEIVPKLIEHIKQVKQIYK
jgi:electron transfer flavoprotein alpha subunit